MGNWVQLFFLVITGVFFLWFGYSLFFGTRNKGRAYLGNRQKKQGGSPGEGRLVSYAGAPKTCPLCSARLPPGQRVKSSAFPSGGGKDRLMHIAGCVFCLEGDRPRICPVCGAQLSQEEILVARLFDKPGRSHVHVLGCSHCRRPGDK
jgi:hypothetical protein